MANTNTQPLYDIKTALVNFRDAIIDVTSRFDSYFQSLDQQISQSVRQMTQDTHASDNTDAMSNRSQIERLNEVKQIINQYQECKEQIINKLHTAPESGSASNDAISTISRSINLLEEYLQYEMQDNGPTLTKRMR